MKRLFFFVLMLTLSFSSAVAVEYIGTGDSGGTPRNFGWVSSQDNYLGQSFNISAGSLGYSLSYFNFTTGTCAGGCTDNAVLQIQTDAVGLPSGTTLQSYVLGGLSASTSYSVDLLDLVIDDGEIYHVVFNFTDGATANDYTSVRTSSGNTYANGNRENKVASGSWNAQSNDLTFFIGYNNVTGLLLKAKDVLGVQINNFNVTFNNGSSFTTTTGSISLESWANGNYTVTFEADNYIDSVNSFEFLGGLVIIETLYIDNNVNFNFYDEQTKLPVLNVTYTLFADGYSLEGNTTTGNLTLSSMASGFYTLSYTSDGYTSRNWYLNVPLTTGDFSDNDVYLLEDSAATTFVLTVTDQNNQPIRNTLVYLQRGFASGGSYSYDIVQMMRPSFVLGGSVPFTAEANTIPYSFTVLVNDLIVFSGTAATQENVDTFFLIDSELFIRVNFGQTGFQGFQDIQGLTYNLSYINSTSTFRAVYADSLNKVESGCLEVRYANNLSLYSSECSNSISDILLSTVDPNRNESYIANLYVNIDGSRTILDSISKDFTSREASNLFGNLGLFITILALILASTALATSPGVMVVVDALILVAAGSFLLGFVIVPIVLQGTIVILSFIIAYIVRGK